MASGIRVGSIGDVAALENSCSAFTDGLRDAVDRFVSATAELGSSWRDAEFRTIEDIALQIKDACGQAQNVVDGILIPFVSRKRSALESRPA